jgi:hypothetical protein
MGEIGRCYFLFQKIKNRKFAGKLGTSRNMLNNLSYKFGKISICQKRVYKSHTLKGVSKVLRGTVGRPFQKVW